MSITITEKQIKDIANKLHTPFDDDGNEYTIEQTEIAVENWLLRIVDNVESDPEHYSVGSRGVRDTSVPEYHSPWELQCTSFVWARCKNKPEQGSVYCGECNALSLLMSQESV